MRDLIRHMLTPNPRNRPDIFEIEDILETWPEHDEIELNPDAVKLKKEELRRLRQKAPAKTKSNTKMSSGKDLTPEEIRELQRKLQKEKAEGNKKHQVPLYGDYSKKMNEELYSKKGQDKKAKQDDFDWNNFGDSSNICHHI